MYRVVAIVVGLLAFVVGLCLSLRTTPESREVKPQVVKMQATQTLETNRAPVEPKQVAAAMHLELKVPPVAPVKAAPVTPEAVALEPTVEQPVVLRLESPATNLPQMAAQQPTPQVVSVSVTEAEHLANQAQKMMETDLERAWILAADAHELDPTNPKIFALRGRVLEKLGKTALAHVEYRHALQENPNDAQARMELADFYRRKGEFRLALTTWGHGLKGAAADGMWLSTLFWNRVAVPVAFHWKTEKLPEGPSAPLVRYLLGLRPGDFWRDATYPNTPEMQAMLRTHQETYWLRLLNELKAGRELSALQLIDSSPFVGRSWSASLDGALKQVLTYRLTGRLPVISAEATSATGHVLFRQLNQVAAAAVAQPLAEVMPEDLKMLLGSKEVFAATFLAEGWLEAALQLHHQEVFTDNYPLWVPYELVRAMDSNRSHGQALALLEKQPVAPLMRLLQSEILLHDNRTSEAVKILQTLTTQEGAVGIRASTVLASHYIDVNAYTPAQRVVESHPALRDQPAGIELLARIACLQANDTQADLLFRRIEDSSFLAQSYLARRALEEKDYERAKLLTVRMIRSRPDMPDLRESLNKILEAEARVPAA